MAVYLVIFGAAVHADGRPSGTLVRRVAGAIAAAADRADIRFMPTGGRGASGHVEAAVMRDMLVAAGVAPSAILMEDRARDTLESVRRCDRLLRQAGDATAIEPCTSRYHLPRCALLFRMLGWRVSIPDMPSDRGHLPLRKLGWFALKEMAALPYDALLLTVIRRRGGPAAS